MTASVGETYYRLPNYAQRFEERPSLFPDPLFDRLETQVISHTGEDSPHLEENLPHFNHLLQIAESVRKSRNLPATQVQEVILKLCRSDFLSSKLLADLLGRNPKSLQSRFLNPMVSNGQLEYRHPEKINRPDQGYRTVEISQESTV